MSPKDASAKLAPVADISDEDISNSFDDSESDAESSSSSGSDSDSLDSQTSRKRRKISIPLPSQFTAPSRINTTAVKVKPAVEYASNSAILAPIDPHTSFEALNVKPWLVGSLNAMAIKRPTGIQKLCIPEILKGRDCIGGSRTGSGKTVAFAVPILQKWAEDPFGIYALVLTPTRCVQF